MASLPSTQWIILTALFASIAAWAIAATAILALNRAMNRFLACCLLLVIVCSAYRAMMNYQLAEALIDSDYAAAGRVVRQGASPNATNPWSVEPVLITAARYPKGGAFEELLQGGADLQPLRAERGRSVLAEAIEQGYGYSGLREALQRAAKDRMLQVRRAAVRLFDVLPVLALLLIVFSWARWRRGMEYERPDPALGSDTA